MNQRKVELEEKRAKLAAIREEKRRRNQQSPHHSATSSPLKTSAAGSRVSRADEAFIDEVLKEISVSRSATGGSSGIATPRSDSSGASTPAELNLPANNANHSKSLPSPNSLYFTARTPTKNLSLSQVSQLSILPKDFVCYTKQTQTPSGSHGLAKDAKPLHLYEGPFVFHTFEWEDEFHPKESSDDDDDDDSRRDDDDEEDDGPHRGSAAKSNARMPIPSRVKPKGDSRADSPSFQDAASGGGTSEANGSMSSSFGRTLLKELTDNEKKVIEKSDDYINFVRASSKVIERALRTERTDIFIDYVGASDDLKGFEADGPETLLKNVDLLSHDRWSKHRVVTSLQWSPHYNELLLASYGSHEDSPLEPDGVALVWNSRFLTAGQDSPPMEPEFVFHCQSAVMSACFSPFHQNLVIGGTYSGQIVLWDNRIARRTPVQRTPLTANGGHTHPVYCLGVMGSTHAHSLVSISTDGKMCGWALDMLTQPVEMMELTQINSPHRPLAATCMSFFRNKDESTNHRSFFIGSEEGSVFAVDRHGSGAVGRGAATPENVFSHYGPVTGIACHPNPEFGSLLLTSSFDRTVKLWSSGPSSPSSSIELSCLNSFEDFSDYVLDVAWSPTAPSLFASVDAGGVLALWDVTSDLQQPYVSVRPDPSVALNRLAWSSSSIGGAGKDQILAVGDDFGRLWLYDVKGAETGDGCGDSNVTKKRKMTVALEEMRENMEELESRFKAKNDLKKW